MSRTKGARDTKPRQKRSDGGRPAYQSSPIYQDQNAEMPEGYNTRRIRFMQAILPTEPLDKNDVAEMERRFARYLDLCAEWDMKVGNMAAYAAIGICKEDVYDWTTRVSSNPERSHFVKKVQKICAMYREGLMEDGKVNPVTGIFWQKNYDGMRDQQEVVLTPNANPLGESQNTDALKQKYIENTYGISGEIAEGSEKVLTIAENDKTSQKGAESDFS